MLNKIQKFILVSVTLVLVKHFINADILHIFVGCVWLEIITAEKNPSLNLFNDCYFLWTNLSFYFTLAVDIMRTVGSFCRHGPTKWIGFMQGSFPAVVTATCPVFNLPFLAKKTLLSALILHPPVANSAFVSLPMWERVQLAAFTIAAISKALKSPFQNVTDAFSAMYVAIFWQTATCSWLSSYKDRHVTIIRLMYDNNTQR